MRLRLGNGLTRLKVGNSGTSNIGDDARYMVSFGRKFRAWDLELLNICGIDKGNLRGDKETKKVEVDNGQLVTVWRKNAG